MPTWLQLAGMLLTGSLLTAVFNTWANRRRSSADISKLFADTAGQLVQQSNAQLKDIREQLNAVKVDNGGLIAEIGRLEGMIKQLEGDIIIKNDEARLMREEIRNLRNELNQKDQEIEALECENRMLKERVSELERKLAKLVEDYDQEK